MDFNNLYKLLKKGAIEFGDNDALVSIRGGERVSALSFRELEEQVSLIARGLIYLGLKKSNTVCILSGSGNPEATIVDFAIVSCGAISVSIYADLDLDNIVSIVNDSEARFIFIDSEESYLSIESDIRVNNVIYMSSFLPETSSSDNVRHFFCLSDIINLGTMIKENDFRCRLSSIGINDLASIVYTPGTTSSPKGVILTHSNILESVQSFIKVSPFSLSGLSTCHIIPLPHIDAKFLQFLCISVGAVQYYSSDLSNDLGVIKPHFLFAGIDFLNYLYNIFSIPSVSYASSFSSSRAFSFLDSGILPYCNSLIVRMFKIINRSYDRLSNLASESGEKGDKGVLPLKERLIKSLLLSRLHKLIGDRFSFILLSGGSVLEDFRRLFAFLDISLLESYSLTELSSIVHINVFTPAHSFNYEKSSIAFEDISIKLSLESEVLVKTNNIVFSYYKDEDSLKNLLDKDGYFHTGDIGIIDESGILGIVDRRLDLIETKSGELVSSLYLEWKIRLSSSYIKNIFVYGSGKDFITALLVLDRDEMAKRIPSRYIMVNFSKYIQESSVISFIEGELSRINEDVKDYERIKRFAIIENDFSDDIQGVYTPTMRLRRHLILDRYRKLFDQFYSERYN